MRRDIHDCINLGNAYKGDSCDSRETRHQVAGFGRSRTGLRAESVSIAAQELDVSQSDKAVEQLGLVGLYRLIVDLRADNMRLQEQLNELRDSLI